MKIWQLKYPIPRRQDRRPAIIKVEFNLGHPDLTFLDSKGGWLQLVTPDLLSYGLYNEPSRDTWSISELPDLCAELGADLDSIWRKFLRKYTQSELECGSKEATDWCEAFVVPTPEKPPVDETYEIWKKKLFAGEFDEGK